MGRASSARCPPLCHPRHGLAGWRPSDRGDEASNPSPSVRRSSSARVRRHACKLARQRWTERMCVLCACGVQPLSPLAGCRLPFSTLPAAFASWPWATFCQYPSYDSPAATLAVGLRLDFCEQRQRGAWCQPSKDTAAPNAMRQALPVRPREPRQRHTERMSCCCCAADVPMRRAALSCIRRLYPAPRPGRAAGGRRAGFTDCGRRPGHHHHNHHQCVGLR